MPNNMTASEIRDALDVMERMRPPIGGSGDKGGTYAPVSFGLAGAPDAIFLRFVDSDGLVKDIRLNQAVAVSLAGSFAKAVHAMDWMDSAGHIIPDPSPE